MKNALNIVKRHTNVRFNRPQGQGLSEQLEENDKHNGSIKDTAFPS